MANKSRKTRKEKEQAAERRRQRQTGGAETVASAPAAKADDNVPAKPTTDSVSGVPAHEYRAIRQRIKLSLIVLAVIVAVQLVIWVLVQLGVVEIGGLLGELEL